MYTQDKITRGGEVTAAGRFTSPGGSFYLFIAPKTENVDSVAAVTARLIYNNEDAPVPLTAGVWVGAEDRQVHFESLALGQGSNMALPIWGIFMNKVIQDGTLGISGDEKFVAPAGMHLNLDCDGSDADVVTDSGSEDFFN